MESNKLGDDDLIIATGKRLGVILSVEDIEGIIEDLILEGTPEEILHPVTDKDYRQLVDLIEDLIHEIEDKRVNRLMVTR